MSRLPQHDQLRLTDADMAAGSLPGLIDQRRLQEEASPASGTRRSRPSSGIFPWLAIPGHRKVFVRRAEERFLSQHTYRDGERVRPS